MKSVVIDGVRYVESSGLGDVRILILQRGWVVVGRVHADEDDQLIIRNASVVRKWGTTKGLGEIAMNGPTSQTVLDPCGVIIVHKLAVVGQIICEENKWTSKVL